MIASSLYIYSFEFILSLTSSVLFDVFPCVVNFAW